MAAIPPALTDVAHGSRPSRLRLLAPLRYLSIANPEKAKYDFVVPLAFAAAGWIAYNAIDPRPALFGDSGLLKYVRDMLVMAVPFMVGALAAVAMGAPGASLDRRPRGADLYLDGETLTMRQFVCYLLGYLCLLGIVTLGLAVLAELLREAVNAWTVGFPAAHRGIRIVGSLFLSILLSSLVTTVLWALYFLTDVVNRPS